MDDECKVSPELKVIADIDRNSGTKSYLKVSNIRHTKLSIKLIIVSKFSSRLGLVLSHYKDLLDGELFTLDQGVI